jgi:hypothetical protein
MKGIIENAFIFLLAITTHYSQCPGGQEPIAEGIPLADNGNLVVYREQFANQ